MTKKVNRLIDHTVIITKSVCLIFLISLVVFSRCKDDRDPKPQTPGSAGQLRESHPRVGLTAERIDELKTKTNSNEWTTLIARMSAMADGGDPQYGFGAYHFAVAFALTGDNKYFLKAKELVFKVIDDPGYCPVGVTYLRAPGCTGQVAMATDIILDKLSDAERNKIFDYLEKIAGDIAEERDPNWSKWGWLPGNPDMEYLNNFHFGHLQTILNYSIVAYEYRQSARDYFDLVVNEKLPYALEMNRLHSKGGFSAEGTWYGPKHFAHMAECLLMLYEATDGRVNLIRENEELIKENVEWNLRCFMPAVQDNGQPTVYVAPIGDQPSVPRAPLTDVLASYMWLSQHVLVKGGAYINYAQFITYMEENIDYNCKGCSRDLYLSKFLHYDISIGSENYTEQLANTSHAEGKGVVQYRTGWNENDMVLTFHASPSQGQRNSHWAFMEGAFYLFYKGWQCDNLNRIPASGTGGIGQSTNLANTITVNDTEFQGSGDATIVSYKGGEDYMCVKGNLTDVYKGKLKTFERTLAITDKVITVLDHIEKESGDVINFLVQNEGGFFINGNTYTASVNTGQVIVKTLLPGEFTVSNKVMGVKVDFGDEDEVVNAMHVIQAGDKGFPSSVCTLFSALANNGSYAGAVISSETTYVHLLAKTNERASLVTYSANYEQAGAHLLNGLVEGNYTVHKNGVPLTTVSVGADGVLHFRSTGGGAFDIEKN